MLDGAEVGAKFSYSAAREISQELFVLLIASHLIFVLF